MEKRLRSCLQSSAEEFLASATKLAPKSSKPSLRNLIYGVKPSSDLCSSLPLTLYRYISHSIQSFRDLLEPGTNPSPTKSPPTPPPKRPRRSSRASKTRVEPCSDHNPEPNVNDKKKKVLQSLHIYACISSSCVSHPENAFSPSDLLPGVQALHESLVLFELDWGLSSEIANLCEEWWKEDFPGRESLISQSLPFLLSRSLTLTKKQDVHRVYSLREAFSLFDFEDESIEDLKLLLVRCVIAPLYIKMEEGRRFIAFTFGLSAQLLKEMLAMIRSQIPFGRKSMLEAYGDIVFRAWKVAEGDMRDEIENGFLQILIEGAIHASSAAFAASVRRVLGAFINQRTNDGVEKLLFRLAEPVIFRSLQVANSNVRQNALHLLLDLFPLEDPDSTKEVKDSLLDKQFYLLEKLVMDDCVDIRVVAVEGSCRILHLFWEIIPSSTITKTITKIFDDMSRDISHEVRLSTLNGIIYLFGNPQSHEILKVLLPRLGQLILDNVLSIRLAMADLLLLLRDIRNFQFNKVVELDMILSTLSNDQPSVARKLTRLLMSSYFPFKASIEEACNRCVILIKRSPMAGARFCEFAALEGASLESLLELVRVLFTLVLSPDNLDADHIEGLLLAASHLCRTLATEPHYKNALKELFSGEKLKCLFSSASSRRTQSSIIDIVSTISVADVSELLDLCMDRITNCSGISEDVERQAEVRSVHKLLISCGGFDDMFQCLTSLLQKTAYRSHIKFGNEMPKLTKRKRFKSSGKFSAPWKYVNRKKPSNFEDDYSVAVGVTWQIKDLLISEDTQKMVLEAQALESSFLALKLISEVSILQCTHYEYMDTTPVVAYTALSLHMALQNGSLCISKDTGTKKNESSDSSRPSLKLAVLEQTFSHLVNCTEKLLGTGVSENSGKSPSGFKQANNKRASRDRQTNNVEADVSSDAGSVSTEPKRLSNKVKMLTAVLKFMVDATIMGFVFHNHEWCLKFTSGFLRSITSTVRQQPCEQIPLKEEYMKDTIQCLKSSYTYAAKLLNLTLKDATETSPPPSQAFDLANDLLDIITLIESYMGSSYAERFVAAAKPWLPDLILALGSGRLLKQIHVEEGKQTTTSDCIKGHFPTWLSVLSKIELSEFAKVGLEEEDDNVSKPKEFLAFKKFLGMMFEMLKGNSNIQDAVGEIFFIGSVVGMEGKDYGLVLGLVHFVCVKLYKEDYREWGDIVLASLQDIYPQIERQLEEEDPEDGSEKLESARALLEPVWLYHLYETGKVSVMEE
ncbi:hypothetical protein FNV43_RR19113 [Rhamnella rubrinervis]|uniref:Condensin-2 complex subunit G2 n=1 Tax=Rhamnella rubrinervis TaxID=2594499 RepID=A0A8K0EBW1_9ROSA|nr:hypothetical protein FNV43_RR19113 [Rhamnella rubrinervis]